MLKLKDTEVWADLKNDIKNVIANCKTDDVLAPQLESMTIKIDSDILAGRPFSDRIQGICSVLNSKTYYENALKRASDAEIRIIKDFAEKLSMLFKIASYQKSEVKTEEEPGVRPRLPNDNEDVSKIYGNTKKERID